MVVVQIPGGRDPERPTGEGQQFPSRVVGRRRGSGEHVCGDGELGCEIDACEVAFAPAGRDLTGPEQPLEDRLALVPVPPLALRAAARAHVARHDPSRRLAHAREDVTHHRGVLSHRAREPGPHALTAQCLVHAQATQMVMLNRDVRGLVAPVLEQLAGSRRPGDEVARVRPEPCEERQFLAAGERVHRIDLDHPDRLEDRSQVADVDAAGRPRTGESLCRDRDAPRRCGTDRPSRRR